MASIATASAFPVHKAHIILNTQAHYSNDIETELARLQGDLRTIETPVDALKPELMIEVITTHNDQEAASKSESAKSPVYSRYTERSSSRTSCEAQFILNELMKPSLQRVGSGSFLRRNRNPPARTESSQDSGTVVLKLSPIEENDDRARATGVDHPSIAKVATTQSDDGHSRPTESQYAGGDSPGITRGTRLIEDDISNTTEGSDHGESTLAFSQVESVPRTNTCRYIIVFVMVNVTSSATTGLTWMILHNDASAGFALATYMFGVGLAILGSWQSYHSRGNQCTCFRIDSQDVGLLERHVG